MSSVSFSLVQSVSRRARGFTLVVTLAILAAVTILVVGLFGILTREQQVSSTYDAVDQADLAVQAGLERASAMLKHALEDELGVIFAAPLTPETDAQGRKREMLVAARFHYDPNPDLRKWSYQALASGVAPPADSQRLAMPQPGFESQAGPLVADALKHYLDPAKEGGRLPRVSPWLAPKPKFWLEVKLPPDGSGNRGNDERLVGRYCFEVEDVQSRLSLASAGFHDANPDRDNPVWLPEPLEDVTQPPPPPPGMFIDAGGRWRRQSSLLWTLLEPGWEWLPGNPDAELWPVEPAQTLVSSQAMHRLLGTLDAKRVFFSQESWRELLMAPNPLAAWQGMEAELFSDRYQKGEAIPPGFAAGSLKQPQLRALEENTTGAWAAYDELALIPYDAGIEFGGELKLNLNRLLVEAEADTDKTDLTKAREAVEQIADHIDRHLPDFRKRAGGFTLPRARPLSDREAHEKAYLKTLAAGMIDYADVDAAPTINIDGGGKGKENGSDSEAEIEYRGMDAYPLVSEYWQRHRYERLIAPNRVRYSLTDFVELWNLTNQEVSGEVLLSFEYRGRLWVGSEVYPVMTTVRGGRVVSGRPMEVDGLEGLWLKPEPQRHYPPEDPPETPPQAPSNPVGCWVNLRPNEITVLRCPPVMFELESSGIETVTGVQYFGQPAHGNDERESRYRLAFRPQGASEFTVVDLPFQTLERYQLTSTATNKQTFNVNQCGLSYRLRDNNWAFNVGDPRAAYFIDYHQEVIDYDDGCSPWGRNFRGFERMAGGVRTYLWPDGGHNSEPCPGSIKEMNGTSKSLYDLNPTDPDPNIDVGTRPAVHAGNSAAERLKYIQHLSNRGRFFSPTELGHIFDPVMWNPNGSRWEDVEVLYGQHADISPDVFDSEPGAAYLDAHKRFCGGNTLRIGRVEHSAFRPDYRPAEERDPNRRTDRGMAASTLLDLFHCGNANAFDVESAAASNLTRIDGHVNVNTATRDVLRALVAGRLQSDPMLVPDSGEYPHPDSPRRLRFHGRGNLASSVRSDQPSANKDLPDSKVLLPPSSDPSYMHADLVAEAIIRNRPYVTPAEVAEKAVVVEAMQNALGRYEGLRREHKDLLAPLAMDMPVFGYTERSLSKDASIEEDRQVRPQWNDRAAEEAFARLWNNSTTRSRHFQITVTGQAVRLSRSGQETVLATRSRVFQVFIRPVRGADGRLIQQVVEITHSRAL